MLYRILKVWVKFCLRIFFRRIIVTKPALLSANGPLLIAANHPNSFLDALIIDVLFKQPVWSLARGDVFKNKKVVRLLTSLRILPVYRISEGVENLNTNYETFDACQEIFRRNGLVLIFSEGLCVNEWHLRPLKKGTARLALSSWNEGIPLQVLPVGINYSKFFDIGQDVYVHIGRPLTKATLSWPDSDGNLNRRFNEMLFERMQPLVYEIDHQPGETPASLRQPASLLKKVALAIPASLGWLLHLPLYLPIFLLAKNKAHGTGHFDSILAALLILAYPFYLLLAIVLLVLFTGEMLACLPALPMPLLAKCFIEIKKQ